MPPGEIHSFSKHIARLSFRLQVGNICATFCKITTRQEVEVTKKGVGAKGKTEIWKAESSEKSNPPTPHDPTLMFIERFSNEWQQ